MPSTLKGPGIFISQFAGDEPPFDTWPAICRWAAAIAFSAGNVVIANAMSEVIDSVKRGGTISEPLKANPVFPAMVSQMVSFGESTGELDWMLAKIADFYEERVAAAVKALTSIIEPVMIVFIGGMVGFIVIAMYLPLFKVYNEVQ